MGWCEHLSLFRGWETSPSPTSLLHFFLRVCVYKKNRHFLCQVTGMFVSPEPNTHIELELQSCSHCFLSSVGEMSPKET